MSDANRETVEGAGRSGVRGRVEGWLDSDLVGIPAAAYTFLILAVSLLVFRAAGGVAGMIVGAALWIPMVLFAIQGRGKGPARLQVAAPAAGLRHRVLVVANLGLGEPSLCEELCRRGERTQTEAMIVVPVTASSRLAEISDDVDREMGAASERLDSALEALRRDGVTARGRTDIAPPMEALLDGLREFPANEILMLPDREANWDSAAGMAERVRIEVGLPVTTVQVLTPQSGG